MKYDDFLEKQIEIIKSIEEGNSTWLDLNNFRAEYYGEKEHPDTTSKGMRGLRSYIEAGWIHKPEDSENSTNRKSIAINKDGSQISEVKIKIENEENLKDAKYLLALHGYDDKSWNVINASSSQWGSNDNKMYSSKITVKPKVNNFDFDKIKLWYDSFESKKVNTKEYIVDKNNRNCLVLPISDLHFNLLSTAFITGNEYNKKIATDNFYRIICDVIERTRNSNLTKILLVLGNDMFNANGISGQTYKGTPQTEEGHSFEAYIELSEIVINAIETLYEELNISIDVIFVPSNHDKEIAFYFMYNLYTYYKNYEHINIDFSPLPRKYYKFGKTLFMFSHDMKPSDVADTFLYEAGDLLSGTEYYECLLAHLHSEIVKQDKNLTIRRLPTLSGKSAWANDENFGSKKVHQSFIYNYDNNITDCLYINV